MQKTKETKTKQQKAINRIITNKKRTEESGLTSAKGITLIALVITIIVLLILASVAINLTLGDNGIFTKAKQAKELTIIGEEKEAISIAYSACAIENLGENVTENQLQKELTKNGKNATVTSSENNLIVTYNETNHSYTVDQNGNIDAYDEVSTIKIVEMINNGTGITDKGNVVYLGSITENTNGKIFEMNLNNAINVTNGKLRDVGYQYWPPTYFGDNTGRLFYCDSNGSPTVVTNHLGIDLTKMKFDKFLYKESIFLSQDKKVYGTYFSNSVLENKKIVSCVVYRRI